MRYLSVCSGIEAATVAWHPLGWAPVAFSEIDRFPSEVLAHHYPDVPNLGDMTRFKEWPDAALDVLVGGTPCQSFSVAGLRAGLRDPRGNLALTYLAIAERYRPRWLVWENVPGVLSSDSHDAPDPCPPVDDVAEGAERVVEDEYDADENHAFACVLAGLSELGYGFAYRSLDAQYFGLAQRRRRVFVVGHLGDWRRAAAVLFERESLSGHPAPRRETREDVAAGARDGIAAFGWNNTAGPIPVATAVNAHGGAGRMDFESETLLVAGTLDGRNASRPSGLKNEADVLVADTLREHPRPGSNSVGAIVFDTTQITSAENRCNPHPGGPCHPLAAGAHPPAVAFDARQSDVIQYGDMSGPLDTDGFTIGVAFQEAQTGVREYELAGAVRANGPGHDPVGTRIREGMRVRRLTPRECERLQGFPDDYTLIPYRGKLAADGPRYKALGNSMAVPVMRWIGKRIALVDTISG